MFGLGSPLSLVHRRTSFLAWLCAGFGLVATIAGAASAAPPPCVTLTCPPDTTILTASPFVRRFCLRNCGATPYTYGYRATSAWIAPLSGSVTLSPGEQVSVDVTC